MILRNCVTVPFKVWKQIRFKSSLNLWHEDLKSDIKKSIENHWKDVVHRKQDKKQFQDPYYVLSMFPYPSGNLHMGHVRVYSISDTLARFYALSGKDVIHPMGWDAFGLPAENAAIERNLDPDKWTKENISAMKKQLIKLGFNFDWERELITCSPDYYKWTQHIFLKLYENGLVYRAKALVNWDPIDQTVLADEQVDENGRSWRSGALVEKKHLNQWFIKTTKFAKQLYDGLQSEILEDWKDIVNLQRHWIGECDGISVTFDVSNCQTIDRLDIWSEEPCKFKHAEFITVTSDSVLAKSNGSNFSNIKVNNPITGKDVPVFICDTIEYALGRDVYIASPSISENDYELALELNLKPQKGSLDLNEDRNYVIKKALELNRGGFAVSSKLKDWLISRQRYWGTPIPMVHCDKCGTVPLPYEDLPVKLPQMSDMSKVGVSPLTKMTDWLSCQCPKCGQNGRRETDTMDTFVDSSWYFLRYLDSKNCHKPFDIEAVKDLTPVNLYIGGKEHAVLHLYYARFMTHFLHSIGWLNHPEPFKQLLVQGMVMGKTYRVKSSGKYVHPENVVIKDGKPVELESGQPLQEKWEKMSKSKYNGVNPESLLEEFGCDTTRMFLLSDVPPTGTRRWSSDTFPNILNWQHRLWLTMRDFTKHRTSAATHRAEMSENNKSIEEKLKFNRNSLVAATTFNVKHTRMLSVAISRMQALSTQLRSSPHEVIRSSKEYEQTLGVLIIMLAPFCPHFACELWAGFVAAPNRLDSRAFDWSEDVLKQRWPTVDSDAQLSLLCKVDGADRCNLLVTPAELESLSTQTALKLMLEQKNISSRIERLEGVAEVDFEKYPGCRGIVNIYTNKVRSNEAKIKETAENK